MSREGLTPSAPLTCLSEVSERSWVLLGLGELPDDSCFIADATNGDDIRAVGFIDGSSGDAFPCTSTDAEPIRKDGPAVHVINDASGQAGQVTVRQEQGNYLRICRWDRIDSDSPILKGAHLRTLPQCGCGGSLGTPKLFASFAEMVAYHFVAFYL